MAYISYLKPDALRNRSLQARPSIGDFNVNKVGGSVLWLRGDDGVFTDVSGLVPAGDGESVYRWNDHSERDNDCFQVYQPSRPTLNVNGLNNHDTLVFEKSSLSHLVANNPGDFDIITPTIYVVGKIDITGTANTFCGKGDGNNSDGRHRKLSIVPFSAGTNFSWWSGTDAMSGCSANATVTNWNIYGIRAKWNKMTILSVNGVETVQTATVDNTTFNTKQFCIGCGFSSGAEYLDGEIAELILYNRVLSNRENRGVIDYLATKYNISVANIAPESITARS